MLLEIEIEIGGRLRNSDWDLTYDAMSDLNDPRVVTCRGNPGDLNLEQTRSPYKEQPDTSDYRPLDVASMRLRLLFLE